MVNKKLNTQQQLKNFIQRTTLDYLNLNLKKLNSNSNNRYNSNDELQFIILNSIYFLKIIIGLANT